MSVSNDQAIERQGLQGWIAKQELTRIPERGWFGGTLAGVADRYNMPAGLLRLMWVIFTPITLGALAVLYVVLNRTVPVGPPRDVKGQALAVDAGLIAPEDTERPYLKEFLTYLGGDGKEPPKPILRFKSHGFVSTGLEWPPNNMLKNIGFYQVRMAFGTVAIYPGWLVFLTEARAKPGRIPAARQMGWTFFDQLSEARKFASIGGLLRQTFKLATPGRERTRFERLLGNPNSFFVPLSSVRGIKQKRALGPRIEITTTDREIVLGPNGMLELGPSALRLFEGFYGRWQPVVQDVLTSAAKHNAAKPAPAQAAPPAEPQAQPVGAAAIGATQETAQPEGSDSGPVRSD